MVALPDDDHVVAIAGERRDRAVGNVHERAGGFDDPQSESPGAGEGPFGRAVGRHHQGRRLDVRDFLRDRDALVFEGAQDGGVVDEVAENRERPGAGVLEGEGDGIPDAEAHAEVGRSDDTHAEGSPSGPRGVFTPG
jgi:hypothetical protein